MYRSLHSRIVSESRFDRNQVWTPPPLPLTPPTRKWRIPYAKGKHVCPPGSTNGHTLPAFMAHQGCITTARGNTWITLGRAKLHLQSIKCTGIGHTREQLPCFDGAEVRPSGTFVDMVLKNSRTQTKSQHNVCLRGV